MTRSRESVIYQNIWPADFQLGRQESQQDGEQCGVENGRKLEHFAVMRTIAPFVRRDNVPMVALLKLVKVTPAG